MKNTEIHPTAEWIYQHVRQDMPRISLGTIYRNLKLLEEEGRIKGVDSARGVARFDAKVEDHYHFRCQLCNSICDVDVPVDKSVEEMIKDKKEFKVIDHRLEFLGLCGECNQANH